jgi:CRP-like cAMP-binding protein
MATRPCSQENTTPQVHVPSPTLRTLPHGATHHNLLSSNAMDCVHTQFDNFLLAALPKGARNRLFPNLRLVHMPVGTVVYEPHDVMRSAYFPVDCVVSLLYVTEGDVSTEIAGVGNEGIVGIALFMGGQSTSSHAIVQSTGSAYRLPATILQTEFDRNGALQKLLLRYTLGLITRVAQTAACNRHHSIKQQFCRWLLVALDRRTDNTLSITQALIADSLGVRREGISETAIMLQKFGVIACARGAIRVLDRPALERLSCECYAVVKVETARLLRTSPSNVSFKTLNFAQ